VKRWETQPTLFGSVEVLGKMVVPIDCVFLGYAQNSAAYEFIVIKSEINGIDANTIF